MSKDKLAVVFPGTGYTCRTGLLADGIERFRELGYEIAALDYSDIPFAEIDTFEEAFDRAEAEALRQLEQYDLQNRKDLIFFSKSLGTVVAPRCAARLGLRPRMLYLTPLAETLALTGDRDWVMGMAAGTTDRLMDWRIVEEFCARRGIPCVICEGVGHSLADPGDPARTDDIRRRVLALCGNA